MENPVRRGGRCRAAVLLLIAATATAAPDARPLRRPSVPRAAAVEPRFRPGRVILRLRSAAAAGLPVGVRRAAPSLGRGGEGLARLHAGFGARTIEAFLSPAAVEGRRAPARSGASARGEFENVFFVALPPSQDTASAARAYAADPDVLWATPDRTFRASAPTNDPLFGSLWGLAKIEADTAWAVSTGSGVVVAVVDSGVDRDHPDLAGRAWANPGEIPGNGTDDDGNGFADDVVGWDFVNGDADPDDDNGHGSHVAGIVAAEAGNGQGVAGVAPGARVMALKGLDAEGSGFESDLAAAIVYAAENGARVLNASWGASVDSPLINEAIQYARAQGVLTVAAAGNGYSSPVGYPAALEGVAAVAATDDQDVKADFSDVGPELDLAAPGVDVLSAAPGGVYASKSGTSMAAPHVAGVAALVVALHPDYSPGQLLAALRRATDDVDDPGFDVRTGAGRVNARKAVSDPGLPEVDAPPEVAILYPAAGAALPAGLHGLRGTASDDVGVMKVEVRLDGRSVGSASVSSGAWTLAVDLSGEPGAHRLTARAIDVFDRTAEAAVTVNVVSPGADPVLEPAIYDDVLGAPACGVGPSCDSGDLLVGRGAATGGAEPHAPNTLRSSPCPDGNAGSFHADESIDRLRLSSLGGGPLTAGGLAVIDVAFWAYQTFDADFVSLYHATSTDAPVWNRVIAFSPTAPGAQTLRTVLPLPDSPRGALRAVMTFQVPADACAPGSYSDHDDLVFETVPDTEAPVLADVRVRAEPRRAVIEWTTDEAATTAADYGAAGFDATVGGGPARSLAHAVALEGLSPETDYLYRLRSRDAADREAQSTGTFRTPAEPRPVAPTAYPSPFRPGAGDVRIVRLAPRAELRVLSLSGDALRTLAADENGEIRWDGTDDRGTPLASGVYLMVPSGGGSPFKFVIQR